MMSGSWLCVFHFCVFLLAEALGHQAFVERGFRHAITIRCTCPNLVEIEDRMCGSDGMDRETWSSSWMMLSRAGRRDCWMEGERKENKGVVWEPCSKQRVLTTVYDTNKAIVTLCDNGSEHASTWSFS